MKRTIRKTLGIIAVVHILALSSPVHSQGPGQQTDQPNCTRLDDFMIVVSPRGDKVASFNVLTKKTSLLRLSATGDTRLRVVPIVGPGVGALHVQGAKITRIAAFDTVTGELIPQDLREPVVEGTASPMVGPNVAAYVIGRYAYAFSPKLNRWDVAELAAGHSKYPEIGPGYATVVADGHVYTFSNKTGKWDHIDINKIFDSAEGPTK
jgi:hypothetical protein